MNYKDTKPYMSAFLSVDLLTDFAAFCLTDFIDRRYIHSWFVFSTQLENCCPQGRRNHRVHRVATAAFWRPFSHEGNYLKVCRRFTIKTYSYKNRESTL
jgi:hypothetical protein